jgi:hypothetical protein
MSKFFFDRGPKKPPVFWERGSAADKAAHEREMAAGRRAGNALVKNHMKPRSVPGVDDARKPAAVFGGNSIWRPVTPKGGTKTYESNT